MTPPAHAGRDGSQGGEPVGEKQFENRRTTLSRAPALTEAAYLMIKQKMVGRL
jgi:hypothetical protein